MRQYIAFDSHKHYTVVEQEDVASGQRQQYRIEHSPGAIREYLVQCEPGTAVAIEATANWYWIVDEIEQARLQPVLVHPRKAKLMMGMINKTDQLDVHGLNVLQRNGTLPVVWIPPGELRDLRELTRGRLALGRDRTRLKNRIQAMLAKYGLTKTEYSDIFGKNARQELEAKIKTLPTHGQFVTWKRLELLEHVICQVQDIEKRLIGLLTVTPEVKLLQTLPGIGLILASAAALEIGDVSRFITQEQLAAYSGTVPRVHASGGKVRYGKLRPDVNHYLKWAFIEAGNSVAVNHKVWPEKFVSQRYRTVRQRKGHPVAVGAVARHLAEAAWHVLKNKQPYRDPNWNRGQAREA